MDSTAQNFIYRFGGSVGYAMPDVGLVYHYRGRDYLLKEFTADVEAVLKASLEQGKNLIPNAFPKIDLYPDPNAVY